MVRPGERRFDPFASDDASEIARHIPAGSPEETMQFVLAADESRRFREAREAARTVQEAGLSESASLTEGAGESRFSADAAPAISNASDEQSTSPAYQGSVSGAPRPHVSASASGGSEAATEAAVGKSAAMMSGLVIISRITGFFRTWAQSWALGATVMASCYTVANNLPNQLYELVMGGMLITAFLPVYVAAKKRCGKERAVAYASNLLSLVVLLMGVLAVLAFVFAAQVVWTQSAGATEAFDSDLAVYFFRFFAFSIVLYALSSVISGVLNAERDYLWSTAAPILNNVVNVISFGTYAVLSKSHPDLAVLLLAIGGLTAVLVQVLVQVPALLRHGVHLTVRIDLSDPFLRETVSIGVPTLVVTLESFVTVSVMNSSALSVVANGASIIYYSRLWYMLPYSVLAIPISTAMFTELSDCVARGDMPSYVQGVRNGASKIAFTLVPFALFLITFAPELVAVLGAGRFTADDALLTVGYLRSLSLALAFYGVNTYLQKVCSSLRRMGIFVLASVAAGVVQVVFCVSLTPVLGLPGVALSSVLFFVISDAITFMLLRRELGHIGLGGILRSSLVGLVLGGLGSAVGWGLLRLLEGFVTPVAGSVLRAAAYCAAAGIPALLVTFGIAVALRRPEASFITSTVNRVLRRG